MADTSEQSTSDESGSDDPTTIELAPDINFVAARGLHEQLLAALDHGEVVIDASKVRNLSTAALLVLISFLNARGDRTPPAAVLNPTGPFVDSFSELGLFGSLMRMEFRT